MKRTRPDPKTLDLTYPLPAHGGYRELMHSDGEHLRCPKCEKESVYAARKP